MNINRGEELSIKIGEYNELCNKEKELINTLEQLKLQQNNIEELSI